MNEYRALVDAYHILATLYSKAWAHPAEVPTPVALILLNAREHIGRQIKDYLRPPIAALENANMAEHTRVYAGR